MKHQQKGLTLLESVIALGLSTLLISAIAINYMSEKRKAEQIIAQLQMAKSGVLQYNIDNPESTRLLADLVRPSEAAQEKWKGPYVDTTTRITPDSQFDISKIFPDSSLELVAETINGVIYQAVLLKGTAELQLKSTILAKCGSDCQPLPGRDDIGLLVQQIGIIAQNSGNGFDTPPIPGTPPPPPPVNPPWKPPTVNPPPTIPPVYPPTNPLPPPVNPPPPINPPPPPNPCAVVSCTGGPTDPGPPIPPTPSKCPDGSIRPNNGICPPPPPPPPTDCGPGYYYYAGQCIPDDPPPLGGGGGGSGSLGWCTPYSHNEEVSSRYDFYGNRCVTYQTYQVNLPGGSATAEFCGGSTHQPVGLPFEICG